MDINVSSYKMPKCLEHAQNNLLEEFGITSWKISSGIHSATVIIRYGQHSNTEVQNVQTYRRKPQTEIQRDINRLEKWLDKKHAEYEQNPEGSSNVQKSFVIDTPIKLKRL